MPNKAVESVPSQAASVSARHRRRGARFWATLSLQGVLGAVFLLAGILKLLAGPGRLIATFGALGWPGAASREFAAEALPVLEIVLACWLISGRWPRLAGVVLLAVLVCFTVALVALGFAIGWSYECGCMGPFTRDTIVEAMVRNAILICVTTALLFVLRSPVTAKRTAETHQPSRVTPS